MEKITFKSIQEVLAKYPNTCAMHWKIDTTDIGSNTNTNITYWIRVTDHTNALENSYNYHWQSIYLDVPKEKTWINVLQEIPQIKLLTLQIRDYNELYKTLYLNGLPTLEQLKIFFSGNSKTTLQIGKFTKLQRLFINNYGCPISFVGDLPMLTSLTIQDSVITKFNVMFSHLSPKYLTELQLDLIRKFNQHATSENFESITSFTKLEKLILTNNHIQTLPFSLVPLRSLKHLDLSHNRLTTLPKEIFDLTQLRFLDVSKTPIIKNRIVQSSSEILKIIQDFDKIKVAEADREMLIEILLGEFQMKNTLSFNIEIPKLLHLYTQTQNRNIWQKILVLCSKKIPSNPLLSLQSLKEISILGKISMQEVERLQLFFKTYQISITTKISLQTDVLCIWDTPTIKQIQTLQKRKIPFCFVEHLKEYKEKLEKPYLVDSGDEIMQNLDNLLRSDDENNVMIALQIMERGGLSNLMFEYLCFSYLDQYPVCKNEKLTLLKKYATSAQYAILKKVGNMAYRKRLKIFLESPEFDMIKIVKMTTKYYPLQKVQDTNDLFMYDWFGMLFQTTGEALEIWLDLWIQKDGSILLNREIGNLAAFPKSLTGNTSIKKITLLEDFITPHGKKIIQSMPYLEALNIILLDKNTTDKLSEYQTMFPHLKIKIQDNHKTL